MDSPDVISTPAQAAQEPGTELELLPPRPAPLVQWRSDRGATTAEYAITTLAACGFAALLVVVLKSDGIRDMITKVITTALGLGQ